MCKPMLRRNLLGIFLYFFCLFYIKICYQGILSCHKWCIREFYMLSEKGFLQECKALQYWGRGLSHSWSKVLFTEGYCQIFYSHLFFPDDTLLYIKLIKFLFGGEIWSQHNVAVYRAAALTANRVVMWAWLGHVQLLIEWLDTLTVWPLEQIDSF